MFLIIRESEEIKNLFLFLVNRKLIKNHWWTTDLDTAIIFRNKTIAEKTFHNLKYGNCKIITLEEANLINIENLEINEKIEDERGWDAHKRY